MYIIGYSQPDPSSISHGNQTGPPPVRESSQPMHNTQPLSGCTLQNVSRHPQPSPRNTHTLPNNRQMLPPTNAPTLTTNAVTPIQNHPPSWVEASLPPICVFSNMLTLSNSDHALARKDRNIPQRARTYPRSICEPYKQRRPPETMLHIRRILRQDRLSELETREGRREAVAAFQNEA